MAKFIVTSGQPYTDIDVYACAIAYSELLNLIGQQAEVVLPGPLNASITESIRSWNTLYKKVPTYEGANFVLVDISDPKEFSSFVIPEKIYELYDHRYGFEKYWMQVLGPNAHIEMVGSCATLIWERFKKSEKTTDISFISANLLYTAILSNTLNFKSSVTTDRDRLAFADLDQHIRLPDSWAEMYYKEIDLGVNKDIATAIRNDTKFLPNLVITQIELWNSKNILVNNLDQILKVMDGFGNQNCFLTSPSVSEGINYFCTRNQIIKDLLTQQVNAKFDGDVGTSNKLWLRKELINKLHEFNK